MCHREAFGWPRVDDHDGGGWRWFGWLFATSVVPAAFTGFLGRCRVVAVLFGRDTDLLDVVADEAGAAWVFVAFLVEVVAGEGGDGRFWFGGCGMARFGGLGWQADVLPGVTDQTGAAGGIFVALAVEHVAFGRAGCGSGAGGH